MKIYFTVTGTSFRYGTDFLEKGTKVTLVKEPDNKYDREAIRVEVKGLGKIGYVATNYKTMIGDSWSSGRIYDKIGDTEKGKVKYITSNGVVCSLKIESHDVFVIDDEEEFPNGPQKHCLRQLHEVAKGSMDMSYRVEHALSPWVNFLIMPIFALANAGVTIPDASYFNIFAQTIAGHPEFGYVGMGIFLGLLLGKPLGITLFSFVAVKSKIGEMPAKATWPMFFAVACLGGIGFTMSIFVDTLSFGNVSDATIMTSMRDAGKIAVLMGSIAAGVLGSVLVNIVYKMQKK